ncbi:glycosyltransferase family 4 protein [Seohaeicola saemankumensis]|uniref:Glycosyltransferase family 4 protein n=1 Tax=Seohaeicola saemankumensis TaxID=481181 RepID=A0ABW3TE49_9RHOB
MIIFCHLLNDRSGSPTVLRSTLDALDARKQGLLFVGSQGRGVLEDAGVPTRRYWYRRGRHRIVTLFTYFASQVALYRALSRAEDISDDAIVFVNTLLPFGAMLWGKRTSRPVVVHVHEVSVTPSPLRGFLKNCAARCASQLIYVSRDHRARLPIHGPPTEIILNPVSPSIASRATEYAPRRSGAFNVLMLASPRGYKGVEEFMMLARDLSDRQDITFTLVLNADQSESEIFTAQHSDARNITVHPRTDDPAQFYETADVVLNLSRVDQWIETFGLTLAEAMTFGIPVIAPPVGGPTEIITHGQEGYCIDSRDGAALKEAVLSIADDASNALRLSQAARKRAADFSFNTYADLLRAVIDRVRKESTE